ncbi:nitroreductase [Pseudoroseomonas deserti]|uniref:Putative NAD(P)H nitroreductase n=2 Tax=Teichococcus deserti TaxID=1817963 RepID=A0A1V2GYE3_9PROT|nr:nitroreductase [Pseudoroseomonas deserti]
MPMPTETPSAAADAVLDSLTARRSIGLLQSPAPEGGDLEKILQTAMSAPDHGKLRPWRYVLIRGAARMAFLQVITEAMRARDPEVTEAMLEKQRARIHRTPLIIAVGAAIQAGHKIPEVEQVLTVGAGAMNLLNAFHASGYGAVWLSGANVYDPAVSAALGFEASERLLGFLYVGTPVEPVSPAPPRPDVQKFTRDWRPA